MMYVVADTEKVKNVGINITGHLQKGRLTIVSEKELTLAVGIKGELTERVTAVSGTLYSNAEVKCLINEGGWEHGL